MKYPLKLCRVCNDGTPKPSIKGLCLYHYRYERALVYAEKNKAKKEKPKLPTGELSVFNQIFDERERKCFITGKPLADKAYYAGLKNFHQIFHHVLPKGLYPRFRLEKENIIMVLPEIHDRIETRSMSDLLLENPNYQKLFDLKSSLKSIYNERFNKRTI